MSTETFETECSIGTCRVSFTVGNEFGPFDAEYYMVETLDDEGEWQQFAGDDAELRNELDTNDNRAHAIDLYYN